MKFSLDLCHRPPPLMCVYTCVMSVSRVLTGLSEINVQGVIHLVRTHGRGGWSTYFFNTRQDFSAPRRARNVVQVPLEPGWWWASRKCIRIPKFATQLSQCEFIRISYHLSYKLYAPYLRDRKSLRRGSSVAWIGMFQGCSERLYFSITLNTVTKMLTLAKF